jgi:hypothetical protein
VYIRLLNSIARAAGLPRLIISFFQRTKIIITIIYLILVTLVFRPILKVFTSK